MRIRGVWVDGTKAGLHLGGPDAGMFVGDVVSIEEGEQEYIACTDAGERIVFPKRGILGVVYEEDEGP